MQHGPCEQTLDHAAPAKTAVAVIVLSILHPAAKWKIVTIKFSKLKIFSFLFLANEHVQEVGGIYASVFRSLLNY